jgi:hypothetical protein
MSAVNNKSTIEDIFFSDGKKTVSGADQIFELFWEIFYLLLYLVTRLT